MHFYESSGIILGKAKVKIKEWDVGAWAGRWLRRKVLAAQA